jgi:oxygen-independent coproporphyrinogen-3 oxidase
MALTSLQPLRDSLHRNRFGRSLFDEPWAGRFRSLQDRGFAVLTADTVTLTPVGETLVEAIINTEF